MRTDGGYCPCRKSRYFIDGIEYTGPCPYHTWSLDLDSAKVLADELRCSVLDVYEADALLINQQIAQLQAKQMAKYYEEKDKNPTVH